MSVSTLSEAMSATEFKSKASWPDAEPCAQLTVGVLGHSEAQSTAALFKALADPNRVRIVNQLATRGPICVLDITEPLSLAQSTVSYHLKKLVRAGLLNRDQQGCCAYYSINYDAIHRLASVVGFQEESMTSQAEPAVSAARRGPNVHLPVAVIGAGPVGLAAAARLLERGEVPLVLEAASEVGASVAEWRHVRLFSPWRFNTDSACVRLLEASGWAPPPAEEQPTGADLLERYLRPLAALPIMATHIQLDSRVVAITRRGVDKVPTAGREALPFILRIVGADGEEHELEARAVIDASGTWTVPNPLGASGVPAMGEQRAGDWIEGALPDVLGVGRERFAGKRVLVVGDGHSAATNLLALSVLRRQVPATEVVWSVRRPSPRALLGRSADDQLPARGQLADDLRSLIDGGEVELHAGFHIDAVHPGEDRLEVVGHDRDGRQRLKADRIIRATGFRPDHSVARELRLAFDPILESPVALAPLIDPNLHTCGTVPPHGARELAHPEPDYYVVGMKSYGRAPTFLLATGYEQVRSVVAALVGDQAAAEDVHLELPATGVCTADLSLEETAATGVLVGERLEMAQEEPTGGCGGSCG
jgi:DNA-binding transcriptional ArsR family regulator